MTVHENSLKNLNKFEKGHKKATGRPKGALSMTTVLKRLLKEEYDLADPITGNTEKRKIIDCINLALVAKALSGSERAIEQIFERIDGKVQSNIKLETNELDLVQDMKNKIRKKLEEDELRDAK